MAKKRQFKGAKYKDGILSYNYLGGKGGKGGGDVSIKKKGDNWYFVDDEGKIRADVGDGGKLTSTHIQNLENDGIFDAVKVNKDTGGTYAKGTEIVSKPGDNVGIGSDGTLSDGSVSVQPIPLAESSYTLAKTPATDSTPSSAYPQPFASASGTSDQYGRDLDSQYHLPYNENQALLQSDAQAGIIPVTSQSVNNSGRGLDERKTEPVIMSGQKYSQDAQGNFHEILPSEDFDASLPDQTMTGSPHAPAWQVPTRNIHGETQSQYGRGDTSHQMSLRSDPNRVSSDFESVSGGGGALPTQNTMENMSGQPSYSSFQRSFSSDPALNTGTLEIGEGGEGVTQWGGDDDFYRTKDGTLMKDGGWFSGDTEATQADIDAGVTDQNASPWGSAAGWQAAGSVMKGVGGLASAYTGFKNYELARDAHDTQKAQWQANYTQRLKAYEDNKKLANEEIAAKNRVLASRGQEKSYNTI
jgi:hypothetical protein